MNARESLSPPVAVVCNLYNEESRFPYLVRMLEAQHSSDIRVIFVDDGSTDHTRQMIEAYDGPLDVELIALDHIGLAPARAVGLSRVKDGIAVVLDADMTFEPGWVGALAAVFEEDPDVGGAFSRVAFSGEKWVSRGGQAVREVLYWVRSRSDRPWMVGHGMAVRAEAYQAIDFSADDLTAEDLELSEALEETGWRIAAVSEPAISTEDPATLRQVWKRHLKIGRRTAHLIRKHPQFLLRTSNAGRFFPAFLLGAVLIDRRIALAGEVALTGVLLWVMRQRRVAARDLAPGWVVFHVQTTAALAGLALETSRLVGALVRGTQEATKSGSPLKGDQSTAG